MRFYILNSFRDIRCQNVPKTFGTPCIIQKVEKNVTALKPNLDLGTTGYRFSRQPALTTKVKQYNTNT